MVQQKYLPYKKIKQDGQEEIVRVSKEGISNNCHLKYEKNKKSTVTRDLGVYKAVKLG